MKGYNYIIALLGKSASGKSSVEQVLEKTLKYKRVISTTTRPPRSNEINHIDYHFVSKKYFQKLVDEDKLVEYRYYNTIEDGRPSRWHYGIERKEIDLDVNSYVCVVDIIGLEDLKREFGNRVISVYIDVPQETRRIRAMARDRLFEEEEFIRRCKDDDIKFKDIAYFADIIVRNDNFDECIESIIESVEKEQEIRTFFQQYASY